MISGYIKLWRQMAQQPWYNDSQAVHLFIHLLFKASFTRRQSMLGASVIMLELGQFVTSRDRLAIETGIHPSKVERCLKLFQKCGQIAQKSSTKNRLITVVSYSKFQGTVSGNESGQVDMPEVGGVMIEGQTANEPHLNHTTSSKSNKYRLYGNESEQQETNKRIGAEHLSDKDRTHKNNERIKRTKNEKPTALSEDYEKWIHQLNSDEIFREQVARHHKIEGVAFDNKLKDFIGQKKALDKLDHKNYSDFRKHFLFWIPKSLSTPQGKRVKHKPIDIINSDKYDDCRNEF